MKYLIISLLKSKLLHQYLFTFSQKVTFSLNVNIVVKPLINFFPNQCHNYWYTYK